MTYADNYDRLKMVIAKSGGLSEFARRIGVDRRNVHRWSRVPAEWVLRVEQATGISRYELRPDVYGSPPECNP